MNTSYQDFNFPQRPCNCIETDHGPDVINFYTNASSKSSSVIFVKAQAQSLFGDSNVHCLGQKFITWVKKIEFITWVNPNSRYSLLGPDS